MKLSVKEIQSLVDFKLPSISELTKFIGSQLGQVEGIIDLAAKFKDVLIVKVISVNQIDGSDHLNACLIDDGGVLESIERNKDGYISVVCGAPNVRSGMLTTYLPPESIVPVTFNQPQPFKLTAKTFFDIKSFGMLASEKELDLSDNHEGIIDLVGDYQIGQSFAKTFDLDDQIVEIENKMFTHRPDCFGQIGLAREVSAILGHQFTSPDWYKDVIKDDKSSNQNDSLEVINQAQDVVPGFKVSLIQNIEVAESPLWLKIKLTKFGIRPINNIVDITNYMMMLTGQPLHAYDYDKLRELSGDHGVKLIARRSVDKEKLTLLSGKEIELEKDFIVISTDKQAVGLAGVMGGFNSMIDENTKSIVLEAAVFDMYLIKKTSMTYGLFSDAVTRFTKGQSPFQLDHVLSQTVRLVQQLNSNSAKMPILSANIINEKLINPIVQVPYSYINQILGSNLNSEQIIKFLSNVEFEALDQSNTEVSFRAPYWRTDISIKQDIVEEVGRLYGFDQIEKINLVREQIPSQADFNFILNEQIRSFLSARGANEVLNYSFIPARVITNSMSELDHHYQIKNALSPDLQYYRSSLMVSMLDKIHPNIKLGYDRFALFEIGRVHSTYLGKNDKLGVPDYQRRLSFIYAVDDKLSKKIKGASFYFAKEYLTQLFDQLNLSSGIEFLTIDKIDNKLWADNAKSYSAQRSSAIFYNKKLIGLVGEFNKSVRQSFKLPNFLAGFEIDLSVVDPMNLRPKYQELSKYPSIIRDYCFAVSQSLAFNDVFSNLRDSIIKFTEPSIKINIDPIDIYLKENEKLKQITFRVKFTDFNQTLSDEIINNITDQFVEDLNKKIEAKIV